MFLEYLQDSVSFIENARLAVKEGDFEDGKRLYRVAVFCVLSALESYVNMIADAFDKAGNLDDIEIAFLNDKAFKFDSKTSDLVLRIDYQRLDDKIRFLIRRFKGKYNFGGTNWSSFMELKSMRDSLIHPRSEKDNNTPRQYEKKLVPGLTGIINIMNSLSKIIYRKPLRRKLLDLVPNRRGNWN